MPQQKLTVMISSTARDLPEHRKELVEACLRQNAFPLRMEDLPANSDEATAASLKMVEEADIYIGVFANRYGYVPKANNPTEISVTEMEYNRAVERKIPRLIFIMDKSHPITVDDVEIENAAKLKAFKDRVGAENIVRFFKSPADLRAEVINSLSKLRQPPGNWPLRRTMRRISFEQHGNKVRPLWDSMILSQPMNGCTMRSLERGSLTWLKKNSERWLRWRS